MALHIAKGNHILCKKCEKKEELKKDKNKILHNINKYVAEIRNEELEKWWKTKTIMKLIETCFNLQICQTENAFSSQICFNI